MRPAVLTRYLVGLIVAALLIAVPAAVVPSMREVCDVAQSEEANRLSRQRSFGGFVVLAGLLTSFGVAIATLRRGRRTGSPPGIGAIGFVAAVVGLIGLPAWFATGIVIC